MPAVLDTHSRPFGGGPRDHADAATHVVHHDLEHAPPLAVVETRYLAGDPQRRDAIDAGSDEQVDDPTKTLFVNIAIGLEGSRENGIHAFELQQDSSNMKTGWDV
jgi:hypothetical protein